MYRDEDDVELTLLNEEERGKSTTDAREEEEEESVADSESHLKKPISAKDKRMMVLLCVLCALVVLVYCYFADFLHQISFRVFRYDLIEPTLFQSNDFLFCQ